MLAHIELRSYYLDLSISHDHASLWSFSYNFILYEIKLTTSVLNNIDAYLTLNSYHSPRNLSWRLSSRPCQAITLPEHTFCQTLQPDILSAITWSNYMSFDHLKCHNWTRLGNQQVYSITIQTYLSCESIIHLTSIRSKVVIFPQDDELGQSWRRLETRPNCTSELA